MEDEFADRVAGVGALAEPARRALYRYVVAQPDAVSREQAAEGCRLATHSAKFHLDRLVEVGLLDVEFRRLSGRTGPGAGRPAKLYRRAEREVAVTLPERRYDLAGTVLADAIETSVRDGTPLSESVETAATEAGRRMASGAGDSGRQGVLDVIARHGYEPRESGSCIRLANCPFDALAMEHTALVCGMNHALLTGVLDELDCTDLEARLDPEPGLCCVRLVPSAGGIGDPVPG